MCVFSSFFCYAVLALFFHLKRGGWVNMSIGIWLALVLVLILCSGFFSAAEIATMSINRYRLRHLVKLKHRRASLVQHQLNHPERLLSTVLIGNTLANIIASMAMTFVGQYLYKEAGVVIAEFILTLVLLVFAEMTPKTWAALHPERVSFALVIPLRFMQILLMPLSLMTTYCSQMTLRLFGVKQTSHEREQLSYDELRAIMHETEGLLPKEHQGMLIRMLDLERAQVEDVMIPKQDIFGVDVTEPWIDVVDAFTHSQHTRIPLFQHNIDNLIGVVHVRDIMQLLLADNLDLAHVLKIAEKPLFIPAGKPLNTQILQFSRRKMRGGFVVNEYGDLLGMVTLEDILEEVVGDFTTDVTDIFQDITPQENGEFIIDASIHLKQLHKSLGWVFPQIGPRTLSGLIIEYLGYIPPAECCVKIGYYHITILRVAEQMIKSVRMKKISQDEA